MSEELRKIVDNSSEDLMLSEKGTIIIYTDGSVQNVGKGEFRTGHGLILLYRKKKKFGFKIVGECEYKKEKDDIAEVELKALKRGVNEAISTWEFDKAYVLSDNTDALHKITEELRLEIDIPFSIKFYWVKGHSKILLNEIVDIIASKRIVEELADIEEALVIPNGEPFSEYKKNTGIVGGIGRAYKIGEERTKAFAKLRRTKYYENLIKELAEE